MKLEKRLELIRQSIIDWSKPYCSEKNKYTNKCFARYFYNVHKLNFYNESYIKNNFEQLYNAVIRISSFGSVCGEIAIGGGFGDEKRYRNIKLEVLHKCEELILQEINNDEVTENTDNQIISNIYKQYKLNQKINHNLKTQKDFNMNLELLFTEKTVNWLKELGFIFNGKFATNEGLNCTIKAESGNIYFSNDFMNKSDIQPLVFDNSNKPCLFSSLQLCESLYQIRCITELMFNDAVQLFKDVIYLRWNGSRDFANELFGAGWEYVGSNNAIKVGDKVYKIGDEIK